MANEKSDRRYVIHCLKIDEEEEEEADEERIIK